MNGSDSAKPSIVLNEGGRERRGRQRADAESESRVVAARRVGRGRTLAKGPAVMRTCEPPSLVSVSRDPDRIRVTHW